MTRKSKLGSLRDWEPNDTRDVSKLTFDELRKFYVKFFELNINKYIGYSSFATGQEILGNLLRAVLMGNRPAFEQIKEANNIDFPTKTRIPKAERDEKQLYDEIILFSLEILLLRIELLKLDNSDPEILADEKRKIHSLNNSRSNLLQKIRNKKSMPIEQ